MNTPSVDDFLFDKAVEDIENQHIYTHRQFREFHEDAKKAGYVVSEDDFKTYLTYVESILEED